MKITECESCSGNMKIPPPAEKSSEVSVDFKLLKLDAPKFEEVSSSSDIKPKTPSTFKAPKLDWGKTLVKKIKSL